VCTDCRFPNELEALRKHFASVFIVRMVKVGGAETAYKAHESENSLDGVAADSCFILDSGDDAGLTAASVRLIDYFRNEEDGNG
jgi:hypothetical protein